MDATKRDNDPKTTQPADETNEGAKRLHLSVSRMKKLQSHIKGGPVKASTGGDW